MKKSKQTLDNENKIAQCIRNVTNMSSVKTNMLIDNGGFNVGYLKKHLDAKAAPKITSLLDTISKLDEKDMINDKRLYKHIIFTDTQSGKYGAKLIASALVVNNYTPAFTNNLVMKNDETLMKTNNNFALLTSQTYGSKSPSVKFKKDQINKYNERPGNVNGKKIRFIILDQGFREGIDLFDVKYVHLFEPLISSADEKQAIGRGTRFCGQKGLEFHPKYGWPLYVFRYDVKAKDNVISKQCTSLFELFVKYSNINMKQVIFSAELEKAVIEASIDNELTKEIHFFGIEKPPPIFFGGGIGGSGESPQKASRTTSIAPKKIMDLSEMRLHMSKKFKNFKYPKTVMKNNCVQDKSKNSNDNFVEFTPTQDLVRNYFTPESAYKGLLLYHSVGTGKTCTAIATASSSFEQEGYTILWVTRHTLKSDIWKNMFENICSLVIKEKIKNGLKLPKNISSPMKYMSDGWIKPMSYKQFSNMLLKGNSFYDEIIKKNGKDDPLRKTLIIIDEAHKLYSDNVSSSEKPNTNILEKMLQNSYRSSGKDSAKVLLMTATPYTTNGMDMIKLINLLKENDKIEDDFDKFSTKYLNTAGIFTDKGLKKIQDQFSGYVSYLNRSQDARNFAHPIITNIYSEMSLKYKHLPDKNVDNELKKIKEEIKILSKKGSKEAIAACKIRVNELYNAELEKSKTIKGSELEKCKELKTKDRPICNREARDKFKAFSDSLKVIKKDGLLKCKDQTDTDAGKQVHELKERKKALDNMLLEFKENTLKIKNEIENLKAKKLGKTVEQTELATRLIELTRDYLINNSDELKKQIKELRVEISKTKKSIEVMKNKIDLLIMEKITIKIEIGRAGLGDVSQESALTEKCFSKQANPESPPKPPPPPRRRPSPANKTSKNITDLKVYFNSILENHLSNNKQPNKSFILLNFHPDKLPKNIKDMIKVDKQANLFVNRVFNELKELKIINKIKLNSILDDNKMIGGKRKKKSKQIKIKIK